MLKKLALFGLCLCLCFSAFSFFVACEEEDGTQNEGERLLYDFEQWGPDFQLLRVFDSFGTVDYCDQAEYATSGTGSAELRPIGNSKTFSHPYIYLPLMSEIFSYNYMDIGQVESYSIEIYNAQDEDKNIYLGLAFSPDGSKNTDSQTFILKPGHNTVEYNIQHSLLNIKYDISACYGLYIMFDESAISEGIVPADEAPVYYLDDVKLHYSDEEIEIEDIITLSPGEICDFEKLYQRYIYGVVANSSIIPELGIVTAAEYGLTAPSGEKVLRMLTKPGATDYASWPQFNFPQKLLDKVNFAQYIDNLSDYELKFEMYQTNGPSLLFSVDIYKENSSSYQYYHFNSEVGVWKTCSISLALISENVPGFIEDPGKICICYPEYTGIEEYEFFFDNFRIEKVK